MEGKIENGKNGEFPSGDKENRNGGEKKKTEDLGIPLWG